MHFSGTSLAIHSALQTLGGHGEPLVCFLAFFKFFQISFSKTILWVGQTLSLKFKLNSAITEVLLFALKRLVSATAPSNVLTSLSL